MGETTEPMHEAGRAGRLLGLAGLFPFVLLTIWLASIPSTHIWRSVTIFLLASYGAIVLSFLGGVRWGLVTARPSVGRELLLAAVPPLVGWLSLAAPAPYVFALLAAAFAGQGASDAFAAHAGKAPAWYGRLRLLLTPIVVVTMIVALVATA